MTLKGKVCSALSPQLELCGCSSHTHEIEGAWELLANLPELCLFEWG